MSEQPENVKIHFAYVDHSLERKYNLRKRLLSANEDFERNLRSHYESLTMEHVIGLRKKLIRHLNIEFRI